MPRFLKGNYQVPDDRNKKAIKRLPAKSLTETLEESALAKLGGSMCFVMKGKAFLWTGAESEKTGP